MPQNGLDVELQRTLSELCVDLFAASTLDECNAILQSLVQLAETFPQARTQIGRLLAQNEGIQVRPRFCFSKLAALSTKFLYKKETACSTVSLLAALANNSERNQRLIVASVVGVKLGIDPTKCCQNQSRPSAAISLYALTVPAIVTSTFRRWRKRQRELQNCRLPSGVPPAHNGIPMPCYCDDCLGAEQFLSTWQHHFHDLSRWSRDPKEGATASVKGPSLSTEDFFRVYLAEYQMHVCTVDETLSNRNSSEFASASRTSKHSSLIYYFVSPEDAAAATPSTPPQFNPLFHLSAIAIAAEIDVANSKKAHLEAFEQSMVHTECLESESGDLDVLVSEQVILFNEIAAIESCIIHSIEASDSSCDAFCSPPAPNDYRLVEDFIRLEEQHGQLVQCGLLIELAGEEGNEFSSTTRQLLLNILRFCNSEDHVPLSAFRRTICGLTSTEQQYKETTALRHEESIDTAPLNWNCRIIMTANLSEQVLRIDCIPASTPTRSAKLYSARVSQQQLTGMNSLAGQRSLGLLRLSDEALVKLLQLCRICQCDNQEIHSGPEIYLRSTASTDEEAMSVLDASDAGGDNITVHSSSIPAGGGAVSLPLPGLSTKAQRGLTGLQAVTPLTGKDITATTEKLAKVIADCNERISYLSLARDRELVRVAPEGNRAAAIARCRHCRDLLIQLGKRLALQVKSLDRSAPMSQEKLLRLTKMLRTSINDVLIHSDSFDPWEMPDERVGKLQLDQRVWASGFPDAAYYRDTAMRHCANRKQQQQLSRKLQKKAKDQTQDKQRKGYLE